MHNEIKNALETEQVRPSAMIGAAMGFGAGFTAGKVEMSDEDKATLEKAHDVILRQQTAEKEQALAHYASRTLTELTFRLAMQLVIHGTEKTVIGAIETAKVHSERLLSEWRESGGDPNDLVRLIR